MSEHDEVHFLICIATAKRKMDVTLWYTVTILFYCIQHIACVFLLAKQAATWTALLSNVRLTFSHHFYFFVHKEEKEFSKKKTTKFKKSDLLCSVRTYPGSRFWKTWVPSLMQLLSHHHSDEHQTDRTVITIVITVHYNYFHHRYTL